jgi:coenzyme F420-reducing hydrogenase gamma subunit
VVHKPPDTCASAFSAELDFWRIPHQAVGSCCADAVNAAFSHEKLLEERDKDDVYLNIQLNQRHKKKDEATYIYIYIFIITI